MNLYTVAFIGAGAACCAFWNTIVILKRQAFLEAEFRALSGHVAPPDRNRTAEQRDAA